MESTEWLDRALAAHGVGAAKNPRDIYALAEALAAGGGKKDRNQVAAAFVATALSGFTPGQLQRGAGFRFPEMVAGLLEQIEKGSPVGRKAAREILARLRGKDLGSQVSPWRNWWEQEGAAWRPPEEAREAQKRGIRVCALMTARNARTEEAF